MWLCGCLSTQPWWRPYSVAWIVDDERAAEALGEVVAGDGDEPVVPVDEVEVEAVAELDAGGEHVGVHVLDPGDELAEVARAARLAHAVDGDAADDLLGGHRLVAARQDVDLDALARRAASESLRTWRARPPSTIGGYSQERIRTRLTASSSGAARRSGARLRSSRVGGGYRVERGVQRARGGPRRARSA